MAKVRMGTLAGQVSGSIGATVFSHGRAGAYVRQRSIPVTSTTTYAMQAKERFAAASVHWGGMTEALRLSWGEWAKANPYTDRLGEKRTLDGHAAYCKLGTRLLIMGVALPSTPPAAAGPLALSVLSATGDIGAGVVSAVFTATPQPAGTCLWLWACVSDTASQKYVKNRLKLVYTSGDAQTSPWDIQAVVEARLGTLVVGQQLTIQVAVCSATNGQMSLPLRADVVLTHT